MSMPRVGSKQSSVRTPPATHRAIVTFCWLPPDSRRTSAPARASIWRRETEASAVRRDIDEAGPDRVRGVPERGCGPVDEQLAAARPDRARQDVEQLVLALAF